MAKGPKQVQVVLDFPVKGLDTNWARHDQPQLTSPGLLNVLPYCLDRRARGAKRAGFSVLTGGSVGSVQATYRQARECTSGNLAGIFIQTTEIGEYPYGFKWNEANGGTGGCYEVRETDDATTTPSGTIVAAVARTAIEDCDDDLCGETFPPGPPPPPPTTYRRVRNCFSGGSYTSFAVIAPTGTFLNIGPPVSFHFAGNGQCYKVQSSDPLLPSLGGLTLITAGDITVVGDCTSDELCGTGGTLEYYPLLSCDTDAPTGDYVEEAATTPPEYYIPYDDECNAVYVAADAVEVTDIGDGRVLGVASAQLYPITSCEGGELGWYEDPTPATIDVTFSGVLPISTIGQCVLCGTAYYNITSFGINGTHTLTRDGVTGRYVGSFATSVVHKGSEPATEEDCETFDPFNDSLYNLTVLEVEFFPGECIDGVFRRKIQIGAYVDNMNGCGGMRGMVFEGELDNISTPGEPTYTVNNNTFTAYPGTGFTLGNGGTAVVEGPNA